jgi:hypothetical protein
MCALKEGERSSGGSIGPENLPRLIVHTGSEAVALKHFSADR